MNNHDYDSGIEGQYGGPCRRCGKSWWHEEHFDGDRKAAGDAYLVQKREQGRVGMFRKGLATGVRVVARDDHPRDDIAGRSGVVLSVETATDTATVRFDPDGDGNMPAVALPTRYLQPGTLPTPPKFSSVEEAEEWMAEHAPEMAIKYPKLPPQFSSTEEADEWLRRQAGEMISSPGEDVESLMDAVAATRGQRCERTFR